MLNQKSEVLKEVKDHFQKQFRKRNTQTTNLPKRWEKAYEPLKKVDTKMYNSLESKVSEKEWLGALKKIKPKLAPGPSSIIKYARTTLLGKKVALKRTSSKKRKILAIALKKTSKKSETYVSNVQ